MTDTDASLKYVTFVPRIMRSYGWNPGDKAERWIGKKIKERLGSEDATFLDVSYYMYKSFCL